MDVPPGLGFPATILSTFLESGDNAANRQIRFRLLALGALSG
jgi:hypothetical protein